MPPGETGGDGTPTLPCINSSVVHVVEEMEPPLVVVDMMMRSKITKIDVIRFAIQFAKTDMNTCVRYLLGGDRLLLGMMCSVRIVLPSRQIHQMPYNNDKA